jgi:hypothetical protein
MCRNNLSRSDEGNVRIASSISRAVLIDAYDTVGRHARKEDQHANPAHTFRFPVLLAFTSNIKRLTSNIWLLPPSPKQPLGTPSRKIAKAASHRKKFRLILPLDAEVFEEANHWSAWSTPSTKSAVNASWWTPISRRSTASKPNHWTAPWNAIGIAFRRISCFKSPKMSLNS